MHDRYNDHHARDEHDDQDDDSADLAAAESVVAEFLDLLRRQSPRQDILDAEFLAARHAVVEAAFCRVIAAEPSERRRLRLVAAGCMLAQFQPGIGQRIVIAPADTPMTPPPAADQVAGRIDLALLAAAGDSARIRRRLSAASDAAAARFAERPGTTPFMEDGTYTWYGHGRPH